MYEKEISVEYRTNSTLSNLNLLPFWAATGTPQMLEFAIAKTAFLSKVNPSGVRNAMSVFAVES